MRFDATLPPDENPSVGTRIEIAPDRLISEWDNSSGRGTSFVPRRITGATKPRYGTVLEVREQNLADHLTGKRWVRRTVILEDAKGHITSTGVLLSVIGDTIVCDVLPLSQFLDWVANRSLRDDQMVEVANAATAWLCAEFPEHAAAAYRLPKYDTEAEYKAWVLGVCAVLGDFRVVPLPPGGVIDPGPARVDSEAVIKQARARLDRPPEEWFDA
jgi:hypothetical protein